MVSQVEHPPQAGRLGAHEWVSGRLVSNPPPPDAILMGCERQIDEISGLEVTCRGCGRKDSVAVTEGSLFKAAQGALLNVHHVFSGAEEE